MAKKINYEALYTLRKDGRYQGSYTDEKGRHYVYDRDPEKLHQKLQAKIESKNTPHDPTFKEIAEMWEVEHRDQIEERTWKNYAPHFKNIVDKYGSRTIGELTALEISDDISQAKAQGRSATIVKSIRSIYRMIFDFAVVLSLIHI